MKQQAEQIDGHKIPYKLYEQNSNSTVASVMHSVGLAIGNTPNDASYPAANHTLGFDISLMGPDGVPRSSYSYVLTGTDQGDIIVGNSGDDQMSGDIVTFNESLIAGYSIASDNTRDELRGGSGLDLYGVTTPSDDGWSATTSGLEWSVLEPDSGVTITWKDAHKMRVSGIEVVSEYADPPHYFVRLFSEIVAEPSASFNFDAVRDTLDWICDSDGIGEIWTHVSRMVEGSVPDISEYVLGIGQKSFARIGFIGGVEVFASEPPVLDVSNNELNSYYRPDYFEFYRGNFDDDPDLELAVSQAGAMSCVIDDFEEGDFGINFTAMSDLWLYYEFGPI